MFEDILKAVKIKIDAIPDIKNCDFYEGQLEDIENYLITPPHVFIELEIVTNLNDDNFIELQTKLNFYVCSSHLVSTGTDDTSGMFAIMEAIIENLHNEYIFDGENNPIDKMSFSEMTRLGIFPGLAVYLLSFNLGGIYG